MPLFWNHSAPLMLLTNTVACAVRPLWWRVVLDAASAAELVVATMAIRTADKVVLLNMAVFPRLLLLTTWGCACSGSRSLCAAGSSFGSRPVRCVPAGGPRAVERGGLDWRRRPRPQLT